MESLTDSSEFTVRFTAFFRQGIKVIDGAWFPSKTDKLLFIRVVECPIHQLYSSRRGDIRIYTSQERCPQSNLAIGIGQTPILPSDNRTPTRSRTCASLLNKLTRVDLVFSIGDSHAHRYIGVTGEILFISYASATIVRQR
jgi:hypothetical protein